MARPLDYLPFVGEPLVRRRLNEIFSRQMLGAVFVGAAAAKIVEKLIDLSTATTVGQLVAWSVTFVLAVALFVWWERLEGAASDLADGVGGGTEPTTASVSLRADAAFEEAEEAREVADRAEEVALVADKHATEAAETAVNADERAAAAAEDARQAEKKAEEVARMVRGDATADVDDD